MAAGGNSQSVTTTCEELRRDSNCFWELMKIVFDILEGAGGVDLLKARALRMLHGKVA